MLTSDFFKKWYSEFAKGVDNTIMSEHVIGSGNCPWHIFTWGGVDCLEGDEALKAWFDIANGEDVYFYDGFNYDYNRYDYDDDWVDTVKNDKLELTPFMKVGHEVFITALDFSWTFVWTHEGTWFGPYFCRRKNN